MKRWWIMVAASVLVSITAISPLGRRQATTVRERIVVTAIGMEWGKTGCIVSVQAVDALKTASEQNEAATTVYTADAASVSAALGAFLDETGRQTYILHTRLITIGAAGCSGRSLFDALDFFVYDDEVQAAVPVCVCREDTAKLLALSSDNDAISAQYVVGVLRENAAAGRGVDRTLADVRRAASGMWDAVLPIVKVQNGKAIADGTLLFCEGVAAGELTVEQTLGLSILMGQAQRVWYTENGVTYEVTFESADVQAETDSYRFVIRAVARVAEQQAGTTADAAVVGRWIEERVSATLAAMDEARCDALGLARKRAQQEVHTTQKTARSQLFACDKAVLADVTLVRER